MIKTKYAIILIVLPIVLCVGFITMVSLLNKPKPSIKVVKKAYHFPDKQIMYSKQSFEDGRINYLVCDNNTNYICKIKQEKYPYSNVTHSCDVTLVVDGKVHENFVHTVDFGENRTILLWEDSKKEEGTGTKVRISIIHLNECRKTADFILHDSRNIFDNSSDLIIRQLSRERKIVTYDDTFDIFFKDNRRCGFRECKLTINDEGKLIKGPVGFMENIGYKIGNIHSIDRHSSAKGYVYTKLVSNVMNVGLSLMQSNGSEKQLKSIKGLIQLSVVNETIGVCSRSNLYSNISCVQYNADGEIKLNISFGSIEHTHFMDIYTLPGEGFLLKFTEFAKCYNATDCDSIKTLGHFIVKVDKTGKEIGKFHIKDYVNNYALSEERHFWKNEDHKSYCAFMLNNHSGLDELDLTANCFTDANFSL